MDISKITGIKKEDFKRKPIESLINLILLIFVGALAIYLIYQIILKLLGHSPEEIEIIKNLVYLLLGLEIRNMYVLGKIQGKLNSVQ